MAMYSIGEFGKQIGVTPQTLRNWDKKETENGEISVCWWRYYELW